MLFIYCSLLYIVCCYIYYIISYLFYYIVSKLPKDIVTKTARGQDGKIYKYTLQISPQDCTGCSHCIKTCPNKCLSFIPNEQNNVEVRKMTKSWNAISALQTAYKKDFSISKTTIRGSQFNVYIYIYLFIYV